MKYIIFITLASTIVLAMIVGSVIAVQLDNFKLLSQAFLQFAFVYILPILVSTVVLKIIRNFVKPDPRSLSNLPVILACFVVIHVSLFGMAIADMMLFGEVTFARTYQHYKQEYFGLWPYSFFGAVLMVFFEAILWRRIKRQAAN